MSVASYSQGSRSRSRSRSPVDRDYHNYPLMVVIPGDQFEYFDDSSNLTYLKQTFQLDRVDTQIPDDRQEFTDGIIKLYGGSTSSKIEALESVTFTQIFDRIHLPDADSPDTKMIIPSKMVSLVIGHRGQQIERFQASSHTTISVLNPIEGVEDRLVSIKGRNSDIITAIERIYRMIVERQPSPRREVDPPQHSAKFQIKFVVPRRAASNVFSRTSSFVRSLRNRNDVEVKDIEESIPPCTDNETIIVMTGALSNCQEALNEVLKEIHYDGDAFKLFISSNLGRQLINESKFYADILRRASFDGAEVKAIGDDQGEYVIITIRGSTSAVHDSVSWLLLKIKNFQQTRSPKPQRASPRQSSPYYSQSSKQRRAAINIAVPDKLVARLIGRNGENIQNIMKAADCSISFLRPNEGGIRTPEGVQSRLCTFRGSPSSIADGLKMLLDQIIKLERHD